MTRHKMINLINKNLVKELARGRYQTVYDAITWLGKHKEIKPSWMFGLVLIQSYLGNCLKRHAKNKTQQLLSSLYTVEFVIQHDTLFLR